MPSRLVLSAFTAATLALTACGPTATSDSPRESTRAAVNIPSSFPDPSRMTDRELSFAAYEANYENSLFGLLTQACGGERPTGTSDMSRRQRIRAYEAHKARLPKIAECWVEKAPEMAERRAVYIEYLIPIREAIRPRADGNRWLSSAMGSLIALDLESEIDSLPRVIAGIANNGADLDRDIARTRSAIRQNRQSWARAAATATAQWTAQNQDFFTRPGPGQTGSITRTTTLIPNASPQVQLALNAMDRTMFGEDAYLRAVARDLAAYGTGTPAASGDGPTIELTRAERRCTFGRKADDTCMTQDEAVAQSDAQWRAQQAQDMQRLATQRAAARALAAERAAQLPPVIPGALASQR